MFTSFLSFCAKIQIIVSLKKIQIGNKFSFQTIQFLENNSQIIFSHLTKILEQKRWMKSVRTRTRREVLITNGKSATSHCGKNTILFKNSKFIFWFLAPKVKLIFVSESFKIRFLNQNWNFAAVWTSSTRINCIRFGQDAWLRGVAATT